MKSEDFLLADESGLMVDVFRFFSDFALTIMFAALPTQAEGKPLPAGTR